ncbi:MFS transporter [Hoeflea prorocentri]|uniref:MFS transporter n=1 Tax=Hoeflea prorocentri TaxID=1922333 RepID=A0A9X3UIJ1_9HYPH|nr:MFS transporter [Hoeflea prorocentri]MCY6381488.1 MFS transporter [Hoeflea prorocentri]MDA5399288.1 MFS transporter [Hoeflea prorocentri]
MNISRFALLMVVFIDIMGQGLMYPLISSILLDTSRTFLPHDMPEAAREVRYGIVIGLFFISWFFGAAFISKLSDYIGRKTGIIICLTGMLTGYMLTILALMTSSFVLLVVGRIVAGFTAGNQPIAQAALIDMASGPEEKGRFMGYIAAAAAGGLMGGPIIVGVLGSTALLGSFASLQLPAYFAAFIVLINLLLIQFYFKETLKKRRKIDFGLSEVFLTLWRVAKHPVVARLSGVFFFAVLGLNCFFIFLDNYVHSKFGFGTFSSSAILVVAGAAMAFGSTVLLGPVLERFSQIRIVTVTVIIMAASLALFIWNPVPALSFVLVIPILCAFSITYPTLLLMFSETVDETEQGWVMGVTIALFTLGSGSISLIGGLTMATDRDLPFLIGIAAFVVALILVATAWRSHAVVQLDPKNRKA